MDQRLVRQVIVRRPFISVSYLLGLTVALFARGFSPDAAAVHAFGRSQAAASEVDAFIPVLRAEAAAAANEEWWASGWFSCDDDCQRTRKRAEFARAKLAKAEAVRDQYLSEGREAVGLWSTFGVDEVRQEFWAAWAEGTAAAQRLTMMDAFSMALMGGTRDETMVSVIVQVVIRFVINLTLGLVIAIGMFLLSVLGLIYSYGPSFISGAAFYVLLVAAVASVVASFFGGVVAVLALGAAALPKQRRLHAD